MRLIVGQDALAQAGDAVPDMRDAGVSPGAVLPLFPCVPLNPPALPWPEEPYLPALSGGEWLGVEPLRRCAAPEPPLPYALELGWS